MTPPRALIVLICLLLAGQAQTQAPSREDLFKQVFGKRADKEQKLEAELELDGYPRDGVAVTVKGTAVLDVDVTVLIERLADVLDAPTSACLQAIDPKGDRVAAAADCGLSLSHDPASLKLRAVLPADHRVEQALDVRRSLTPRTATATDASVSAYLNLSASLRRLDSGREIRSDQGLGLDGALRWRGTTFEYDGLCGSGGCTPGLRSLVYDHVASLRRWRAGDLTEARAGTLGLPALRGLSVGTAFELAPALSYTPDLDTPLELDTAASVEVLVNGRPVQRFQLPAGRYSVRDFPLAFGANQAELRITDAAGRLQTRTLEAFVDLALLDENRSRYAFSLGQPVIAVDDAGSLVQPWTLAADYARGIGPRTTISAAAASIPALQRSAAELGLTRAFGRWLVGSELACSFGQSQGCRADLRFRRGGDPTEARPGWRFEGALGYRQADYADLLGTGNRSDSASLLLRGARALGDGYNLAIGVRSAYSDGSQDSVLSAQIGGRLLRNLGFRVSAERVLGEIPDTRYSLSLTWLYDRARQSLQLDAESTDQLSAARWQINRNEQRGGYSASVGSSHSDLLDSADASFSYRHERAGADVSIGRFAPAEGLAAQDARLTVRSALVYADGEFGMTERVLGAFAIVAPSDPVAAGTVYVNPVDVDYLASSLGPGPAVVPALRAYDARALVLVLPELARDHDPGELFPVALPGYKGGVVVRAGGAPTLRIEARIVDADGSPVTMVSGSLQAEAGGAPLPVFAGRDGRLRAAGLTPGRWTLVLDTRPARRHAIVLPADASGVLDLGVLTP